MKIEITSETTASKFCNIFTPLKQFAEIVKIYFKIDEIYIQGMDAGHVLLYEITLKNKWFNVYNVNEDTIICVNASIFAQILDIRDAGQHISITNSNQDKLTLAFKNPVTNVKKSIDILRILIFKLL